MAEDMGDEQVLKAAITIRGELESLVPADSQALGAELDKRIGRAQAAEGEERSVALDEAIAMLTRRRPTQRRLNELISVTDTDRVAAAGLWAPDAMLAGVAVEDDEIVTLECQTCHYVNRLRFRPPAGDPPPCQNPAWSAHLLKLP